MYRLLLIALLPGNVAVAQAPVSYYQDKERGWFWKERAPDTPTSKETEPHLEPVTPMREVPLKEQPLTSAWFREHLGAIRDEALDQPSPEKVRRFFILQKALLDKAERFAETAQRVVLEDPLLDEKAQWSTAADSKEIHHEARTKARDEALGILSKRGGLLFIFRSDCRYCHIMAPIVQTISHRHGIKLISVSLDGGGLPGFNREDFHIDPNLAGRLHLKGTPALFLMTPPKGLHPVLQGSSTAIELEDRLLEVGVSIGLIDETAYRRAKGQPPEGRPSLGMELQEAIIGKTSP